MYWNFFTKNFHLFTKNIFTKNFWTDFKQAGKHHRLSDYDFIPTIMRLWKIKNRNQLTYRQTQRYRTRHWPKRERERAVERRGEQRLERESVERGDSARLKEKKRAAARRLSKAEGEEKGGVVELKKKRRAAAEGKIQKEKARVLFSFTFLTFPVLFVFSLFWILILWIFCFFTMFSDNSPFPGFHFSPQFLIRAIPDFYHSPFFSFSFFFFKKS